MSERYHKYRPITRALSLSTNNKFFHLIIHNEDCLRASISTSMGISDGLLVVTNNLGQAAGFVYFMMYPIYGTIMNNSKLKQPKDLKRKG